MTPSHLSRRSGGSTGADLLEALASVFAGRDQSTGALRRPAANIKDQELAISAIRVLTVI
jgi:hypothetical protein